MPSGNENEFGDTLRSLREQSGKSLRELAEQSRLHFNYLSKVERGDFDPPSADTIVALAKALNTDPDQLLVLGGKVPPDLQQLLSSDLAAVKKVRKALKR